MANKYTKVMMREREGETRKIKWIRWIKIREEGWKKKTG